MSTRIQYTTAELAQYLRDQLRGVANDLTDDTVDWTSVVLTSPLCPYKPIIDTTTIVYFREGGHDVSEADNLRLLNILARIELWRAVMQATVSLYDIGGPARTLKRDQIHLHAVGQFRLAQGDLETYIDEQVRLESLMTRTTAFESLSTRVSVSW